MIKVSLLVTAGPQRPGALTALHTAQAVARSSHQLYRIFFYGDGETNYIMATVTLFVSIYNLFLSLLHILTALSGND